MVRQCRSGGWQEGVARRCCWAACLSLASDRSRFSKWPHCYVSSPCDCSTSASHCPRLHASSAAATARLASPRQRNFAATDGNTRSGKKTSETYVGGLK
ncbi:hypothetical protein E2C01_003106 [Portunus trituberculatus]|uniref:Uncharacterized protein n=1 Tax=Portunus trituberculatus TaxID=210409 RepID=A0A5B7CLP2_PORTR|nr:hypothetical protein [Portunus trituberculatus]